MSIMTSKMLKSMDSTKTQNSRYLKNETFFLQIKKKSLITHQRLLYWKNSFVAEVTFNTFTLTCVITVAILYNPLFLFYKLSFCKLSAAWINCFIFLYLLMLITSDIGAYLVSSGQYIK